MKLLKLSLLSVLSFVIFSCSNDDDGGSSSNYAEGWTTEKINKEIEICEISLGPTCKCIIEETAKVFDYETYSNEDFNLNTENIEKFKKIEKECSSDSENDNEKEEVNNVIDVVALAEGWTQERVDEAKGNCALAGALGGGDEAVKSCECGIDAQSKVIPFASQEQPTEEQQKALQAELLKCAL